MNFEKEVETNGTGAVCGCGNIRNDLDDEDISENMTKKASRYGGSFSSL